MLITAQAYPIPKAGGTFQFQLLPESGGPVTIQSISCTNSTVNSSIVRDDLNLMFTATFPANSTTSTKTYTFNCSHYLDGTTLTTESFQIEQTGTTQELYTNTFFTPFVQSFPTEFHSTADPSNYELSITTMEMTSEGYNAPHYRSVSEYWYAAQNGEITNGEWVYVDGKWNSSLGSVTYSSSGHYIYNVIWIDPDATPSSSVRPHIEFDKLYGTGNSGFNAKPSNETLATYKTIGFKHSTISSTTTSKLITSSAFIQATQSTFWSTETIYDGTSVDRPLVQSYNLPMTNVTISSLGNNNYRVPRSYTSASDRARWRIVTVKDPNTGFSAEKAFLQVPETAVNITNTALNAPYTAGTQNYTMGTYGNAWINFDSSLFSISFPNGQPDWITSATVTNPSSNNLRAVITFTENTSNVRTCNARLNWLDKYTNITITQAGAPGSISISSNPAVVLSKVGTYYIPLNLVNIDTSTLSVTNNNTSKFSTSIYNNGSQWYLQAQTLTDNTCGSSVIGSTVTITADDNNGNAISYSANVQQSNEDSDYTFTPQTTSGDDRIIPWSGETIDFTFDNVQCPGVLVPRRHITGINSVTAEIERGNTRETINLNYTTSKVSGLWHCYVVFPQNIVGDITSGQLYFDVAEDFDPWSLSGTVQYHTDSTFTFQQATPSPGSITFRENERWVNSKTWNGNAFYEGPIYFDAVDIDLSTLTYSSSGDTITSSINFNTNKTYIYCYIYNNSTENVRTEVITVSGTDYLGVTRTGQITIKQYAASDGWFLHLDSPTTSSSNRLNLDWNDTFNVSFSASGLSNLQATSTTADLISNYSFTNTSGNNYTGTITIDNEGGSSFNTTIRIVGTNRDNEELQSIIYVAVAEDSRIGTITLNPQSSNVVGDTGGTGTINVTTVDMVDSSLSVSYNGSFLSNVSLDNKVISYTYSANTTASSRTATITVSGTDIYGKTPSATFTLTQGVASGVIIITPNPTTVSYWSGYRTVNVETRNFPAGTVFNITNTGFARWFTLSNGVLEFQCPTNESTDPRTDTVTISGVDNKGDTITATLTIIQNGVPTCTVTPHTSEYYDSGDPIAFPGPLNVAYNVGTVTFRVDSTGTESFDIGSFTCTDPSIQELEYEVTTTSYGYDLEITLPNNVGTAPRTFSIYCWADVLGQQSLGRPIYIKQAVINGTLSLEKSSDFVCSGPDTYYNAVTYSNIDTTTLWATVTSGNLSYSNCYFEPNSQVVLIMLNQNSSGAMRSGVITLTADDYNGNHLSATWSISQTDDYDDSYQTLISPSSSSSDPVIVDYNGTLTATFETYRTTGVYSVWDYYGSPIDGWTATPTSNGYSVTVQFIDNETYTQKNYLLRIHWINEYTEGNCKNGDWCELAYVRQKGLPGTITLSPSAAVIRGGAGATASFTETWDHINSAAGAGAESDGDWLVPTSRVNNLYTVTAATANRTNTNRTASTWVYGWDWQGDKIQSNSVTVIQEPLNYLEWTGETTKTIGPTEGSVQFLLSDFRVSNLTPSFNGNVQIGNYTITETTGGHILTVYTVDNPNYVVLHSTITVSGTNSYGETITTPTVVHLYKNGPDGSITVDPTSKTVTKTPIPFAVSLTNAGMDLNSITATGSGDVTFSNLLFDSNKRQLTITCGVNNTNDTIYGVVTISGTDYKGKAITATVDITQLPYDSVINITPATQTLDYGENTATYTVEILYVDNVQVSVTGDTSFITNQTLSNGVLTVTTADFQQKTAKTATITISGQGIMGNVSSTATIVKYGPDGTITTNPDTLTFPKSPKNRSVSITTSGIVGAVTVSSSGTVSFSSLTINGSTLVVYTNENLTSDNLSGTITITGTDYKGNTITANIAVTQKPYDSYIELSPATKTVNKDSGSTTYTLTTDDVDLSTLRVSHSGPSITNSTLVGNTVTVTYSASTIVANRVGTVTVSGVDIYDSQISTSAELVQTGIDPTITANTLNIAWDNSSAVAFVATNGVGNISVSFSGDVTITDYSIAATTGGYNITIVTPDNPTNTVYHSVATVTGTVTEGQYEGQTRSTTFNVNKFGKEGVITIEPTAITVRKAATEVVFDIALANMQNNTVTASTGTFNSDKSELTVSVSQNPSNTDRTITVTVSGTDTNGETKSASAVITQYGIDPYIKITPSSRNIPYDVMRTSFNVSSYKVTNLQVAFDGDLEILDYTFDGTTLVVDTPQNDEAFSLISNITISGIDELGDPISTTARLTKAGNVGTIIVDQSFTMPSNNSRLIIDYDLYKMDPDSIYVIGSLDTVYAIHRDKKIYVVWGQNNTNETLEQTIYICGTAEDGLPVMVPITITKLPSGNTLTLSPYNTEVDASSGTTTITVTSSLPVEMTYSGSMEVNSCTYSNGTITVNRKANPDEEYKRLYITCKAGDVSSSSIITQEGSGDFDFDMASPATVYVDAGYHKVYFDSPSFRGEIMEPYAETGIILTSGEWPTKPTVKYDANGFPYTGVPLNVTTVGRELRIIQIQEASYEVQILYTIIQEAGVEPDIIPIWKEFVNSVSSESFIEYHINLDGDIIYAGKAYKYPDSSNIEWSINDTVSNYLGNGIRFSTGIQEIPNYSKDFFMRTNEGDKFIETYYNSWAYKDTDYWLSDPIDYRVDQRQWLPVSFISTNYDMITVGGRTYAAFKPNDGWTVMTRLNNLVVDCDAGIQAVSEDGSRLTYRFAQGDYVLYYSNAYGGWDSLLCNGTSKKTDNIEHMNYRKKSRNQSDFSKVNYQNNITPTWSLKTGITIDGSKMFHLLESTMVYLHNLETNEIIPVVITNSQCEYLTYTNNGKKPYFYNITVEESNQKLRK